MCQHTNLTPSNHTTILVCIRRYCNHANAVASPLLLLNYRKQQFQRTWEQETLDKLGEELTIDPASAAERRCKAGPRSLPTSRRFLSFMLLYLKHKNSMYTMGKSISKAKQSNPCNDLSTCQKNKVESLAFTKEDWKPTEMNMMTRGYIILATDNHQKRIQFTVSWPIQNPICKSWEEIYWWWTWMLTIGDSAKHSFFWVPGWET
jgi:hypothetical protein